MTVSFSSGFSKLLNSTKKPTGGTSHDCALKDNCSILRPRISLGGKFNPAGMMYCHIPAFNRYYYVTDWEWIGGGWVASLSVDPMATYKDEIGQTSAYITRANTADYNKTISDGMFPATTEYTVVNTFGSAELWRIGVSEGTYIVGIISSDADTAGSVTYYAMSNGQFSALKSFMFQENFFQDVMGFPDVTSPDELLTSISPELLKVIFNPAQYIVSAMWFPLSIAGGGGTVKFGWWETDVSAGRLGPGIVKTSLPLESITLPKHPQADTRGSYLNYAPFSEHMLFVPPFGSFAIDPSFFNLHGNNTGAVNLEIWADLVTGKANCIIRANNAQIGQLSGQIGVPVQLSQVGSDILGTAVTAIQGAGSVVSGGVSGFLSGGPAGAVVGAIGKGAEAIYNTINTAMPQVISSGVNGSYAGITSRVAHVVSKFYKIADADDEHRGRPVCKIDTIGNYSGFVQCAEGDISIPGTEEERSIIAGYMTSGFFYE